MPAQRTWKACSAGTAQHLIGMARYCSIRKVPQRRVGDDSKCLVNWQAAGPAKQRFGMTEDRPALAATLMVGALCMLSLQDSLVKLASADVSLWQFQSLRALFNLTMLFVLQRFIWGNASAYPKRFWTVALRSCFLIGAMLCFFGAIPFWMRVF